MIYKDDWEEAKERIKAWWQGEIIDRVCIQVTARKDNPKPISAPGNLFDRWTDVEYILDTHEERFRCTYWGGEAFPYYHPNLGPDMFAAFLGADLIFAEGTSWIVPLIKDWNKAPSMEIDPDNEWWKRLKNMMKIAASRGSDKFYVAIPDTHSGGDALAALRGRKELCLDLIDHPNKVKEAMRKLEKTVIDMYEELYPISLNCMSDGSCGWLPAWGPGRSNVIQCDFIALISSQMCEEFFLNEIKVQAEWLDHTIFHLDGPDAIRHLDLLLNIPEIEAIQWVPGAGSPSILNWIPLLKRIQNAGRSIHIGVSANDIEALLSELSPRGLMLRTGVGTVEEAKELLKKAEKWTANSLK